MTQFYNVLEQLHRTYGNIVKLSNLHGRNDIVFLFDTADIEKVYRNEGIWPVRPQLKCLTYYRKVTRKDVFGDVGDVLVE
jgi:cytochrome P450 family 12